MASDDYYSILGVDRQAPDREIKRAYYNLARDLHPDRAKSPDEARGNAERLAVISKAYNTLKDPAKRAEYDSSNAGAKGGSGGGAAPARPSVPAPKAPTPGKPSPAPPAGGAGAPSQPVAGGGSTSANSGPAAMSGSDMQAQRVLVAQRAFVKGMEFWKNTDYKSAAPFFQTAVENDPESEPHYHMKLAICLMKTKKSFMRAVEAAEKACAMDSYNMEFKNQLGEIYEAAGVQSKAVSVYEDILKWEPDNQKAKFKLGILKKGGATSSSSSSSSGGQESFLAKMLPSIFGKK